MRRPRHAPLEWCLVEPGRGVTIATGVEVADRWCRRLLGWIGRTRVPDTSALWLPATRAIHTLGLRGPIDVLFLDRNGTVLAIRRRLPPWRIAVGPRRAAVTVELAPGRAAHTGLAAGQRLALRPSRGYGAHSSVRTAGLE